MVAAAENAKIRRSRCARRSVSVIFVSISPAKRSTIGAGFPHIAVAGVAVFGEAIDSRCLHLTAPLSGGLVGNQLAGANRHDAGREPLFADFVKHRAGYTVGDAEFVDRSGLPVHRSYRLG
jgi:hypothetical protein